MSATIIDFRTRQPVPAHHETPLPYSIDIYEGPNGMASVDACVPMSEARRFAGRLKTVNPVGKIVYPSLIEGGVG
jgi:hypothetical protein